MSNVDLMNEITKKLKSKIKVEVNPNDIKLIQIGKNTKVYEIPYSNIKVLYLKKSNTIMINTGENENKLA